jgi:hypothetical protein
MIANNSAHAATNDAKNAPRSTLGEQKATREGRLSQRQQMQKHRERKTGCTKSPKKGLGIIAVIVRKSKALG